MNAESLHQPIRYYKALDGLRGYAVVMVLLFHAKLITWGWMGVYIFFVLSGFLIGRNLLESKGKPDYYKSFFVKRITRIFPIYYLMLFSTIAWSYYRKASNADAWMYIIFIQNFKLVLNDLTTNFSDWFDHTWTLAVEEQFYFFFPFIVAGLSKQRFKIFCFVLIATGLVTVLTLPLIRNSILYNVYPIISYMAFLCGGAWLATLNTAKGEKKSQNFFLILLSGIIPISIAIYFLFLPDTLQSSFLQKRQIFLAASLPFIIFIVQFLTSHQQRFIAFLFENKIIVYIGKISYGLYLYHFGIFILCFVHKLPLAATFAITFLISALSWHFIEQPCLGLRNKILRKPLLNKTLL